MRRKFLHVEHLHAMRREDLFRCDKGKVRKVLVIDGVELVLLHQTHQVRELHCDYSLRSQQNLHSLHKVIQIRNLSQDVVAKEKVGGFALLTQLARRSFAKEFDYCWNSFFDGDLGNISSVFYSEDSDAFFHKVLQKIAVVARDFDNGTPLVEAKSLHHLIAIAFRMGQPTIRVRREVRVIAEDVVGSNILFKLH